MNRKRLKDLEDKLEGLLLQKKGIEDQDEAIWRKQSLDVHDALAKFEFLEKLNLRIQETQSEIDHAKKELLGKVKDKNDRKGTNND